MVRRFLLTAICLAAVSFGQSFEAAAIKPNDSGSGHSSGHSDNGSVRLENYSLKQLIQQAYDVEGLCAHGTVVAG